MKSIFRFGVSVSFVSLSSRRAWIEIASVAYLMPTLKKSLSSRRAWIEIVGDLPTDFEKQSRSPHGERGLKLDLI